MAKINWAEVAFRIPAIIGTAVTVIDHIKAPGVDKKKAVIESIPHAVELAEYAANKNFLNDANIAALVSALIDAEAAALKARGALRAGLLEKGVVTPGEATGGTPTGG